MKRDDGSDSGCEELRADAERNRQLLLQAAREVFADQGLDASSKEIARRAGWSHSTCRQILSNVAYLGVAS